MTATWTAPRTWATGEVVTESMLNTHVRDNLDWLKAHADARSAVHALGSGEYIVGTRHGKYRIEIKTVGLTSSGDNIYTASGSWDNAFGSSILAVALGVVSTYNASDGGRNNHWIQAMSTTGFTAALGDSGGGNMGCTYYVWGFGRDA